MRLMLAVDIHDPNPERLVNEGVLWAQRLDARLDLGFVGLRAWSLGSSADPEVKALLEREGKRVRQSEQARLDELMARVPQGHRGDARVLEGSPIDALCEASRDHAALLVGTHGRKGLRRFWLGSVSEQLVRRAICPVLVLRLYDDGRG